MAYETIEVRPIAGALGAEVSGADLSAPLGNQVFADGSVQWIDFRDMVRIHSWGGESRQAYGYLDDYGGYVPPANPFF